MILNSKNARQGTGGHFFSLQAAQCCRFIDLKSASQSKGGSGCANASSGRTHFLDGTHTHARRKILPASTQMVTNHFDLDNGAEAIPALIAVKVEERKHR